MNAHFNSLLKKILKGQRAIPVSWVVTRELFDVSAWIAVCLQFNSALAENPLLRLSRPVLGPLRLMGGHQSKTETELGLANRGFADRTSAACTMPIALLLSL